ncbi:MAG: hypothetical protein WC243_03530 [Patescibacteria group bacterium]|jgi:hypothetical protein
MEDVKPKNSRIVPVLVAGLLALSLAVIYFVMKQPSQTIDNSSVTTEVQTEQEMSTEPAETVVTPTQPTGTVTQTQTEELEDHSDDIDSDLNSLDSLDLSTAENDLGDDKISDL